MPLKNAVQQDLIGVYKRKEKTGGALAELSVEESESLLAELMKAYPRTISILDALDESYEQNRGYFLLRVVEPLVSKPGNLKVLISSRCDDDITQRLEKNIKPGY